MCGRFYIDADAERESCEALLRSSNAREMLKQHWKTGDILPTEEVPVIANNRQMIPSCFAMRWGYMDEQRRVIINARAETAADKMMFSDGIANRRCLIPMSGYYEWRQVGRESMKYTIKSKQKQTSYLAGIYRFENRQPTFVVLTRKPSPAVAHIHDRMPVILTSDIAEKWLQIPFSADDIFNYSCADVVPQLTQGTEPMFDFLSNDDMAGIRYRLEE